MRRIAGALKRRKTRVIDTAEHEQVESRAVRKLRRARRSLRSLDWDDVKFAGLSSELRLAYKRARGAMGDARKTGSDEDFHEWRKQIKALWYTLRLLEKRVSVGSQLASLERLETWLGDDHNLAVLQAQIAAADRLTQEEVEASGVAMFCRCCCGTCSAGQRVTAATLSAAFWISPATAPGCDT